MYDVRRSIICIPVRRSVHTPTWCTRYRMTIIGRCLRFLSLSRFPRITNDDSYLLGKLESRHGLNPNTRRARETCTLLSSVPSRSESQQSNARSRRARQFRTLRPSIEPHTCLHPLALCVQHRTKLPIYENTSGTVAFKDPWQIGTPHARLSEHLNHCHSASSRICRTIGRGHIPKNRTRTDEIPSTVSFEKNRSPYSYIPREKTRRQSQWVNDHQTIELSLKRPLRIL
ncbi:uncharacterized protein B0H18DRAFT_286857 [Fomitopsis serialis]|uniref:uncharacterized protein n=1 Tax=Fomitopsis serialis TaxID=139415 RepID=UPI0020086E35|nr:uncharacterized protein B0H18DRAFT_286857 [Neoantrodia serialis]KAH9911995.1 hypothetical protein B0H18DRAFT_286857 [Neoantrodia serialis]